MHVCEARFAASSWLLSEALHHDQLMPHRLQLYTTADEALRHSRQQIPG